MTATPAAPAALPAIAGHQPPGTIWNASILVFAAVTLVVPDLLPWGWWLLAGLLSLAAWVMLLFIWIARAVWVRRGAGSYRPRDVVSLLLTPAVFLLSVYLVLSGTASSVRFHISEPALRALVESTLVDDVPQMPTNTGLLRVEDAYSEDGGVEILLREGGFMFPSWEGIRWERGPGEEQAVLADGTVGHWTWWYESD